MTSSVRIYDSENTAREISSKLVEAGFLKQKLLAASEVAGQEAAAVKAAVQDGFIPAGNTAACVRALQAGKSLVGVDTPFGTGQVATRVLASNKNSASYALPYAVPGDPAPLSSVFNWPVLSTYSASTELLPSNWAFSSGFGLGLLCGGPSPLSSMFRFPTVSKWKTGKVNSFGFPMLSKSAAPLSSLFGMATVLKQRGSRTMSMGFPLLSDNPAPFSSLFGMSTVVD